MIPLGQPPLHTLRALHHNVFPVLRLLRHGYQGYCMAADDLLFLRPSAQRQVPGIDKFPKIVMDETAH